MVKELVIAETVCGYI